MSAVHVPGGTFIHSAVALAPHAYLLALEGIVGRGRLDRGAAAGLGSRDGDEAVRDGGRRPSRSLAAIPAALVVHARWDRERTERRAVAAALDLAGASPDARLMTIDAAGYRYYTGHGGVVTPNDPLEHDRGSRSRLPHRVAGHRARTIGPALAPVFTGEARPRWIGPRLIGIPGPGGRDERRDLSPSAAAPPTPAAR